MKLENYRLPLILFLIGIAFYILGALFNVFHLGMGLLNGATLLIVASVFQLIAIVIAIVKLIKQNKQ